MTISLRCSTASLLALAGLPLPSTHRGRSFVAVVIGLCPPIVCGCIAQTSGGWGLFERSGSITAAIGLLAASRRYVHHSIIELVMSRADGVQRSDLAEVLEDILTAKLGLALSGFGTVIWGWGQYLGWLSFSYLLVWAFFAIRDAHRDHVHLQSNGAAAVVSRLFDSDESRHLGPPTAKAAEIDALGVGKSLDLLANRFRKVL